MYRLIFSALFFFCAFGVFADAPEFEKPVPGLKIKVTEFWDVDSKDPTRETFDRKITENFDEKDDLVSRELSDDSGKIKKFTYKHVYGADGQIVERSELDEKGKVLRRWSYKRNKAGNLEIEQRIALEAGDLAYVYRFDSKGRLEEWACTECKGSKTKIVNHYRDDGLLKDQDELVEGQVRYHTEFEYDGKGKLRRAIRRNHMNYLSAEESYNLAGDLEDRASYDYYGDEAVARSAHEYTYDKGGRITEDAWMDGKIEKKEFALKRGHIYYKYEFFEQKK